MVVRKKILVVGAGASGLPSIRHALLYEDIDVVCFEATNDVGGLWKYKPEETELSSVMKSTVINTSKEMTAYSDYPPEDRMANFMHNTEMWRYLKKYADHFDLRKYIRFGHKVTSIKRASDYEKTGKWTVSFTDEKGNSKEETFDGILLCSGHHATPHFPAKWPGQDKFKGQIIHSHSYKDHRGYEDKTVVVVGIGNSGADVTVELSRISKQVYLATRRGSWVFNRIFDYGEPFDIALNKKFLVDLRHAVPDSLANYVVESRLNRRFDHKRYGLKPQHRVFGAHPTVNDELPNRIACGTVRVKPNICRFTETGILFEDGSVVDNVDTVVLSTGFSFEFGLVEQGKLIPVSNNNVDLYKYMFPVEVADHNSLAVIGLVQPVGSIMPLSEMQARVFFESFTRKNVLPSRQQMESDIEQKHSAMDDRYVKSRRHTIQVDYITYIDELASLIGCAPDMMQLWKEDPSLAYKVYFGPRVPYIYRLSGPKKWSGARNAIMTVDERVAMATCDTADLEGDYTVLYAAIAIVLTSIFLILYLAI